MCTSAPTVVSKALTSPQLQMFRRPLPRDILRSGNAIMHQLSAAMLVGLLSMLAATAYGTAADTVALSTSDTMLSVEAGSGAPRVAALAQPGGWRLTSSSGEVLPDH